MISSPIFDKFFGLFSMEPSKKDLEAIERAKDEHNARVETARSCELWMNDRTTKWFMAQVAEQLDDEQKKLVTCKPDQLSLLQAKITTLQSVLDVVPEAIRAAKEE